MATKLLLLEDVEALGRSGDVVNVRAGYARNFLLPQGHAIIADKNTLRKQERLREERLQRAAVDRKESEELAKSLEGQVIRTTVKVDHEGHMYGSVSALDIIHLIQNQLSINLEKHFVQLKHAIKETGKKTINLKLKEGITTSIILEIASEEANAQPEA